MDLFPHARAAPAALTRRGFVTGLGGVITAAFLRRVARHVAASGEPLWVAPNDAARALLLWPDGRDGLGRPRFLVTQGQREVLPPEAPTWFAHLAAQGVDLATRAARERVRRLYNLADLDALMPEAQWDEWWARHGATPEREAYDYLGRLPIGPLLPDRSGAPAVTLVDGFSIVCTGPMAFVAGLDAVSLLQARLVELREATALVLMDEGG